MTACSPWISMIWLTIALSQSPATTSRTEQEATEPNKTAAERQDPDRLTFRLKSWRLRLAPGSDLYPRYLADPLRPMFEMKAINVADTNIADSGDLRYGFRLGGQYGFLRLHPEGHADRGFQLDINGAFLGHFDAENDTDNIGWDGLYGIAVSWANGRGLALRLASKHYSAHIGDEYIERTGRTRLPYTREEWALGVSLAGRRWRVYGEAAHAYDQRNEALQMEGRIQGGLEYVEDARWWGRRLGPFAAVNLSAYEENDWEKNLTIQAGLVLPVGRLARTYRIGLEYYDGRVPLGEFFLEDDRALSFGFWFDL